MLHYISLLCPPPHLFAGSPNTDSGSDDEDRFLFDEAIEIIHMLRTFRYHSRVSHGTVGYGTHGEEDSPVVLTNDTPCRHCPSSSAVVFLQP